MNRETILEDILAIKNPYIVINLATGTGKTRAALEKADQQKVKNLLIVCPRTNLCLVGWPDEFRKWHKEELLKKATLCCYRSLHKYTDREWDMIIFDEAHHLTPACQEILSGMKAKSILWLSATLNKGIREFLDTNYHGYYNYEVGMRKTIDAEILPDPKVFLMPLTLDALSMNSSIELNSGSSESDKHKYPATVGNYWKCVKSKKKCILYGTQYQCYQVFAKVWDFYVRNNIDRQMIGGTILKWCATQKNSVVRRILRKLENERTLTFCCNIAQTQALGANAINSKNKAGLEILEKFNLGEIDHIQACNMLDEGVNLVDCRVGIFANINSSERLIIQRTGRILRHSEPIIVIPYFVDTREEVLVKKMIENYNPELIETITSISKIKL